MQLYCCDIIIVNYIYVNDPLSGLVAVIYMMFRDYIISVGSIQLKQQSRSQISCYRSKLTKNTMKNKTIKLYVSHQKLLWRNTEPVFGPIQHLMSTFQPIREVRRLLVQTRICLTTVEFSHCDLIKCDTMHCGISNEPIMAILEGTTGNTSDIRPQIKATQFGI